MGSERGDETRKTPDFASLLPGYTVGVPGIKYAPGVRIRRCNSVPVPPS